MIKRKTLFDKNISIIKKKILEKKVYKYHELIALLNNLKESNQISQGTKTKEFIIKLRDCFSLKTYIITSEKINQERYAIQDITAYDFVNSLINNSFFSMTTALNIQGLSDFRNDFIFYSQELSPKKYPLNPLTQTLIDNAYKKEYRYTSSTARYKLHQVVFLTPKFSNQIEVISYKGFKVSSINRALVEILINIQYFKNFETVIKQFIPLKQKLNIKKINTVLESFNLVYPYFQLLGFALEKIGFNDKELEIFKLKISNFKFYTEKNKDDYHYNKKWQIYYSSS